MAYRTSSQMLPACCMELALTQSQNRMTALWWWTLWLAVPCTSTARPQISGRVYLSWDHPTALASPSSEHLSPACYIYQRPSLSSRIKKLGFEPIFVAQICTAMICIQGSKICISSLPQRISMCSGILSCSRNSDSQNMVPLQPHRPACSK